MNKFCLLLITIMITVSCSSLEPLHSDKYNAYYRLNDFAIVSKDCVNCSQFLNYTFHDSILSMVEDNTIHGDKRYIAEISIEIKNERSAIRNDSTATREKTYVILKYNILENNTGKLLLSDSIMQIDARAIPASPFDNVASSENLAIELMRESIEELKRKLLMFAFSKLT